MGFDQTKLTRDDVRQMIEDADVKALQILHGALMAGIVIFACVTTVMAITSPRRDPEMQIFLIFSIMNGLLTLVCVPLAFVMYANATRSAGGARDSAADWCGSVVSSLRGGFVLRNALMEGAGLFGVMVCFLGATQGALPGHPVIALNAISPLLVLSIMAFLFPTKEKLVGIVHSFAGTQDDSSV